MSQNTEHAFSGDPDARQEGSIAVSRFRPRYRQLSPNEMALHDDIKAKAVELEALIERLQPGRYRSLAMTSLEASVMWAVKQLTDNASA